ncbi:uncharacterized protein BDZ99DRAFT_454266 [Mytilinidion resinicola]|uniref:Uncharacterized protein n=1 Tax=Mytilinidion resinicola TaxID=574789 RepID=A0A6A6Y421_9PEZI|nr:uncharacterized protein BDZ99DRAFT_454266 [Mytilinidion resinicola]KAF2802975.1 hypothetical protein BDZ99DRAFT_454266 [Mytilinidion resinicola]
MIKPTGKNLPSIFRKPRERLDIEWQSLKRRTMDKFGLITWKFFLKGWKSRPRPKLERRALVPLAKDYHSQIYTAFAAHDTPTITRLCCSGLAADFRARMSHRALGTHVTWSLASYTASPKIVSNRASPLPGLQRSGVRQVVVRLASKQILATWTDEQARAAVPADVETVESEVTEYLVLQRRMLEGVEEAWMVWGFAEESTPEVRRRDEKMTRELEEYQRAQSSLQA